jgi:hypothetical protein
MKRLLIACYLSGLFAVFGMFFPNAGTAGINVNINIPLPGIVIVGPPAMMVVPGAYVYFAPDVEADLFFYRGYWYRPSQGQWYISLQYNGPWGYAAVNSVPHALINLPKNYRYVPPGYERMPYKIVKRNWRAWEEKRHWDNYEGRDDEHANPRQGHGMGRGMGM